MHQCQSEGPFVAGYARSGTPLMRGFVYLGMAVIWPKVLV